MARARLIATALGAVALAATAGAACAQTAKPKTAAQSTFTSREAFAPDLNTWGPQVGRRSLQWDSKKARWGVKLDLDPQVGRPLSYTERDVQAGAFFKVSPSLRVGGAVSLGAVNQEPRSTTIPADRPPKVRLETAFKF